MSAVLQQLPTYATIDKAAASAAAATAEAVAAAAMASAAAAGQYPHEVYAAAGVLPYGMAQLQTGAGLNCYPPYGVQAGYAENDGMIQTGASLNYYAPCSLPTAQYTGEIQAGPYVVSPMQPQQLQQQQPPWLMYGSPMQQQQMMPAPEGMGLPAALNVGYPAGYSAGMNIVGYPGMGMGGDLQAQAAAAAVAAGAGAWGGAVAVQGAGGMPWSPLGSPAGMGWGVPGPMPADAAYVNVPAAARAVDEQQAAGVQGAAAPQPAWLLGAGAGMAAAPAGQSMLWGGVMAAAVAGTPAAMGASGKLSATCATSLVVQQHQLLMYHT
jgi:hypothetical protein